MLLVTDIRENKERIIEGLKKRNIEDLSVLDKILEADDNRKKTQFELDNILAESNQLSKQIGELFKTGKAAEANELKEQTSSLKEKSKKLQEDLNNYKDELEAYLFQIPNALHESVVAGKGEEDNVLVSTHGEVEEKEGLPHWELASKYDIIDFELGTKITGAGFPVYKGKGARLQRALINYFLDKNTAAGYKEILPPLMVNEASARGTGQLPDKEAQMYEIPLDGFYMIPTSEVPVTNIYRDVLMEEKDLPVMMTAFSPCFRREAGSYGKDVRGLNRLHQFDKVEIVRIEKPENSYAALEAMKNQVATILEDLGLTYRILHLCGGDTGFASASTFDFEVWSPAQHRWLEVSSVSNFETFQANRLKLRYKGEKGTEYCHTLNGSSLALPRVLASILEHYQVEDGIEIPEVLHAYTGFTKIS
ncbi:serine--tRNA ligase [Weeksellaceae bacterium KMM 9713]|uniref:Serine--tRNA ligase n=1 Tax=Profundicola chukchiensis TaxID=2961959 RepID=A0A9X4RVN0_9FLAO|nr:serine--tRNA ligase [Profundicola chukchiensis]MDG4946876.1 serine--tRNA ligase [Profundicola chukchiensis]